MGLVVLVAVAVCLGGSGFSSVAGKVCEEYDVMTI